MSAQVINEIFYVVVLIMSVVIHEYAHGYSAYLLGDNTAHDQGRLTLNPLKHLDPFGSVILPLILVLTNAGFVIGWARPVPYNPNNLRNKRWGTLIVAIAGVLANILLALIFGLLIRFTLPLVSSTSAHVALLSGFYGICEIIVVTNLVLAVFNLVPIPPLDGSKILFSFIPYRYRNIENFLEKWGVLLVVVFVIFFWDQTTFFPSLISHAFTLITGLR